MMKHQHTASRCCAPTATAPLPIDPVSPSLKAGQQLSRFYIAQMDCPVEEQLIRARLEPNAAVVSLRFNLMRRELDVVHVSGSKNHIERELQELGMAPHYLESQQQPVPEMRSAPLWPVIVAVFLALFAEWLHWLGQPDGWVLVLALLALALTGPSVYKKGLVALKNRNLNINALMSIAVTGAVLIGSWAEAAMVMSLFALAELIEARSLDRVRHAVDSLLNLAPEQVEVQNAQGQWESQPAQAVAVGSVVKVLPGERIGLDGLVVAGHSSVNQAPITGESTPVDKQPGDQVFAGSVNGFGELQFQTQEAYDHSLLVRIALAVQNAQQGQAPVQRFVDRFAQIYTPVVTLGALLLALFGPWLFGGTTLDWVYKALVLLVIACPCALVISTPVAVVSALTRAARLGMLIKGGVYLEQARHMRYLALDKTGTLTLGQPALHEYWVIDPQQTPTLIATAYALSSRSNHPVSVAVAQGLKTQVGSYLDSSGFTAIPGAGVEAQIDGVEWQLGKQSWVQHEATSPQLQQWVQTQQDKGASLVFLGANGVVQAAFAVWDQIKPEVNSALQQLGQLGVQVEMLSGDQQSAAQHIAQQVGLEQFQANLLPADKQRILIERGHTSVTGMVGDGINDAPALAQANIGFAMGALGSDMAIETADVTIMNDDLRKIPQLMHLSQHLHTILMQNISVALGIKAVFLIMALTGQVTMWMAVFADVGASLLVIINSLRLLKKRLRA